MKKNELKKSVENTEKDMYYYEEDLWQKGYQFIAGCDEVGRGPMAGPVVTASVVLNPLDKIEGLKDSKKLTPKKREELSKIIKERALDYSITYIPVEEVDKINVYAASKKGMTECVNKLKNCDYVLTDCMPLEIGQEVLSLIKGDDKSASIAAASIIAKVERDNYMDSLAKDYPMYGFEKHKGYVTKMHLEAIKEYGICKHHRVSFDPVKAIYERDNGYKNNK